MKPRNPFAMPGVLKKTRKHKDNRKIVKEKEAKKEIKECRKETTD